MAFFTTLIGPMIRFSADCAAELIADQTELPMDLMALNALDAVDIRESMIPEMAEMAPRATLEMAFQTDSPADRIPFQAALAVDNRELMTEPIPPMTADTVDEMEFHAPEAADEMAFQTPVANDFRPLNRFVTTDTAPEMTPVMAFQTADAAELMAFQAVMAAPEIASHIPITAARKPSEVFQRTTRPATRAAMAIITRTTGLAAMMKLNAAMAPFTTRMAAASVPRTAATIRTTWEFSFIQLVRTANAWAANTITGNRDSPRAAWASSNEAAAIWDDPAAVSDSRANAPVAAPACSWARARTAAALAAS